MSVRLLLAELVLLTLANVPSSAVEPGDPAAIAAGEPGIEGTGLALKLHNPIADLITVPLENDFELGSGMRRPLTYTLNFRAVVPFELTRDWLLVTRTIVPFISQEAASAGEPNKTGLGDISQSFFLSPTRLVGGWIVGAGPALQYPSATNAELGAGKWGAGPTLAILQQRGGWSLGLLANHIRSFAGNRHRGRVSTTLVDPFVSYTFKSDLTVEFDGESTYDWQQKQWSLPVTAGVSQLLTLGRQSFSIGLDGRWYVEHASGTPAWGIVFTVTLLFENEDAH